MGRSQRSRLAAEFEPEGAYEEAPFSARQGLEDRVLARLLDGVDVQSAPIATDALLGTPAWLQPGYFPFPTREWLRSLDGLGPLEEDQTFLVDGRFDPRANRVDERLLQREIRIPGHGRSSSSRRRRERTAPKGAHVQQIVEDEQRLENRHLPRIHVAGLTRGVRDFYDRRPGIAREVLLTYAIRLVEGAIAWEPPTRVVHHAACSITVYGLNDEAKEALRTRAGTARRALDEYARQLDGSRIVHIDRNLA